MSTPLKTLVFRWPRSFATRTTTTSTSSILRNSIISAAAPTCQKRTIILTRAATAARPQHQRVCVAPRTAIRTNSKLSASGQRNTAGAGSSAAASDLARDAAAARAAADAAKSGGRKDANEPALDWNSFFQLRTRRRRIQLLFSAIGGIGSSVLGAAFLTTGLAEPIVSQIPLDPFVTLGLIVFACGGMGWLVGPSLGSQVFYLMNSRIRGQLQRKETEFFARVKKNRVDPSNSSAGNPVPDFYGEKISSVAGYRQWLKDQRAFNKKKTKNFV